MQRLIDAERLEEVRLSLGQARAEISQRRAHVQSAVWAVGRTDPTVRLAAVEAWLDEQTGRLSTHIEAVRLIGWLQQEPGTGLTPGPVTRFDAVASALGLRIAAAHLVSLPPGEQILVARWRASLVARLTGAPFVARVEANRNLVRAEVDRMAAEIASLNAELARFPAHTNARRWREAEVEELAVRREVLVALAARHPIWFEPGEDGRHLEWIGPPDAQHVVVFVPGTGHSIWSADDLHSTGVTLQASTAGVAEGGVAVIVAMGYDAPDHIPAAALSKYAASGAPELAGILDTLSLEADQHVTLIGHSYGSFVAAQTLSHLESTSVDDLVLVGSPGVGADAAGDLAIDPDRVWVGLTDDDPITLTSADRWATWAEWLDPNPFDWTTWDVRRDGTYEDLWFGTNPAHPEFGAQRLEMFGAEGHSGYFDDRDALDNLARVFGGLDPIIE